MNWSDELKVVWLLPPKTGTRSVGKVLVELGFKSDLDGRVPNHSLQVPVEKSEYNIICNVRNPYSRVVSLFFLYKQNNKEEISFDFFVKNILGRLGGYYQVSIFEGLRYNSMSVNKFIRFENFVEEIYNLTFIQKNKERLENVLKENILEDKFSHEFEHLSNNSKTWKNFYNEDLSEIVYTLVEEDFINFGYEKNSWK